MAYSLDTILAEVVANITAMTGATAATHVIEREGVERQVTAPYVVWVEGEADAFAAPKLLGSATGHANNPRSLYTRVTSVDIHVWATTKEQLENMVDYEIAALHRALHGSYAIKGGSRVAANNALTSSGFVYILNLEIQRPVVDKTYTTTKVTVASKIQHSTVITVAGTDYACGHLSTV